MGAVSFSRYGTGKTAHEAFRNAQDAAKAEVGHSYGYSGDVNAKHGFQVFELPHAISTSKVLGWMHELERENADRQWGGKVKKAAVPIKHRAYAQQVFRVWDEKWGPAVALPVTGTELKAWKAVRSHLKLAPGMKVWRFTGIAAD